MESINSSLVLSFKTDGDLILFLVLNSVSSNLCKNKEGKEEPL